MKQKASTFLQISNDECRTIYKSIVTNGNSLLQFSEKCAAENNFGLAISLAILGVEEWIKGTLILLKGNGISVHDIEEVKKAITGSHKTRHETIMLFQLICSAMNIQETLKANPNDLLNLLNDFANNPSDTLNKVFNSLSGMVSINSIEWWDKADKLKNAGFYADYYNELLLPSHFTSEDYSDTMMIINETLRSLSMINEKFKTKSDYERKNFVKDINKGLKLHAESKGFVTKSKYVCEKHPWKEYIPLGATKLILGTYPTKTSNRAFEFFYPNKSNRFWNILAKISNSQLSEFAGDPAVAQRKGILDKLKVGISDTGRKIYRQKESSLDGDIFPVEFTDIFTILENHQTISTIILTSSSKGNSALNWFAAYCELNSIKLKMPSGNLPIYTKLNFRHRSITVIAVNSPSRRAKLNDDLLYQMYADVFLNAY